MCWAIYDKTTGRAYPRHGDAALSGKLLVAFKMGMKSFFYLAIDDSIGDAGASRGRFGAGRGQLNLKGDSEKRNICSLASEREG